MICEISEPTPKLRIMVDWKACISEKWDKDEFDSLSTKAVTDEVLFEQIYAEWVNGKGLLAKRCGYLTFWAMRDNASYFFKHFDEMVERFEVPSHPEFVRYALWIISHFGFPVHHDGVLMNYSVDYALNSSSISSTRFACMDILFRICKREPELIREYLIVLDSLDELEIPTISKKGQKHRKMLSR